MSRRATTFPVLLQANVTPDLLERLNQVAARQGVTRAELVRQALRSITDDALNGESPRLRMRAG